MTTTLTTSESTNISAELQEKVLLGGDLGRLTPQERLSYYSAACRSIGLNPLTRPFEYIVLNGKLQLYARKDCADQLRSSRNVSLKIVSREMIDGIFVVTAQATGPNGRSDESVGTVFMGNLQGVEKANAIMKAETKAKRRVTLSFCGLGILDESEMDGIRTGNFEDAATSQTPAPEEKISTNGLRDKIRSRAAEIGAPPEPPPARSEESARKDGSADVIEPEAEETKAPGPEKAPEAANSRDGMVAEAKALVGKFCASSKGATLLRQIRSQLKIQPQNVVPPDQADLSMFIMLLKSDLGKLNENGGK